LLRPWRTRRLHKVIALEALIHAYESQGENMTTSTEDKMKGNFHEAKGAIKEEIGKVIGDKDLKDDGKGEKNAGKLQQKIGHAKEGIADLKEKLVEAKK
jgi:uncharacterized protein YjbJ (UPF0337 family)